MKRIASIASRATKDGKHDQLGIPASSWRSGAEMVLLIVLTAAVWAFALNIHSASLLPDSQVQWNHRNNHSLLEPFKSRSVENHITHSSSNWSREPSKAFVFLQISDVHVSRYRSKGGIAHLNAFLSHHIPLFAPELVLVTGDLTDAKTRSTLKSIQHADEWAAYHEALKESGVLSRRNGTFWLDQRGNHDCFNVESFASSANYFKEHSSIKKEEYIVHVQKPFGNYTFAATDACPKYGASRPLNFFGYVDSDDMDILEDALQAAHENTHNHTFIMSHYPTGTTTFGRSSKGLFFDDLAPHISLWLCGHLHNLVGGLGETMYAYHRTGYLELELGDLKSHGLYRIIVVDNDLISFVDIPLIAASDSVNSPTKQLSGRMTGKVPIYMPHPLSPPPLLLQKDQNDTSIANDRLKQVHSQFPPIVLITNPKDARYIIPGKEPVHLISLSSHIRVFVWSRNEIASWKVELDGQSLDTTPEYTGTGNPWGPIDDVTQDGSYLPLWVLPWNPREIMSHETHPGQDHQLKINVTDFNGKSGSHSVRFRLDGSQNEKMESGPGGFIISIPLGLIIKDLTIIGYIVLTIGCLLIPRLFVLSLFFWRGSVSTTENQQLLKNQKAEQSITQRRLSPYLIWVKKASSQLIAIDHAEHVFEKLVPSSEKGMFDFIYYRLQDFVFTCKATFLRFCELSNHPSLFWPLYGYMLYMSIGPLMMGDFIPSAAFESPNDSNTPTHRYAWLMVYGLWFETGEWVPSADTWLFAFHGLAYSTFPLVFYLSFCVTCPGWLYCDLNRRLTQPIHERWYVRVGVMLVILYHVFDSLSLGFFYGIWAILFSPSRSWMTLWGCWMLWKWRNGPHVDPLQEQSTTKTSIEAAPNHQYHLRSRKQK